jgi:hypothetical protein
MYKPIFKLSKKIVIRTLTTLSLLATFINFSELFKDKNIIMMGGKIIGTFILILLISGLLAFLITKYKNKVNYFKNNGYTVIGKYANILDSIDLGNVNIVVPVNRCYDTIIDDFVISSNSVHGQIMQYLFQNDLISKEELDRNIEKSLKEQNIEAENIGNDVSIGGKSKGKYKRYPVGSVALVVIGTVRFHFIAFSKIEKNKTATTKDLDYLIVLNQIVENIWKNSNGSPIYMPLIGSGLSKLNYDSNQLLKFMIQFFELHKNKLNSNVAIMIRKEDQSKITIRQ